MVKETDGMAHFDDWVDAFATFVRQKGKVPPGPHRAWGYQAPAHRWDGLKLGWRDVSIRLGVPPEGSFPAEQQEQGLSKGVTLRPGQSEAGRQYPSNS